MSTTPAAQLARLKTHYGDRWQLDRDGTTGVCTARLRATPGVELTARNPAVLETRLADREGLLR